jgi:hypothetical protein
MKIALESLLKKTVAIINSLKQKGRYEMMLSSKRKFKRFDLPLIVKFKPTYGAVEYATAVTRNLSCYGLCLETKDLNFIRYENLELNIKLPEQESSVSLSGNVVWKRKVRGKSLGGIKLKIKDSNIHKKDMENIFVSSKIPEDNIYLSDTDYKMKEQKKKKSVSGGTVKKSKTIQQAPASGITKQYLRSGNCKVTFKIPEAAAPDAKNVTIVGDFNNWDPAATPMTGLKTGDFKITLTLEAGREYRFKYLIDGNRWENDWGADRYVPNEFGADDSVLIL